MSERFNLKARQWIDQPQTKRQYNVALFTEVARKYGLATRALSLGRDGYWKKKLVDGLPRLTRPRCLDLACGTGDITFSLVEKYPGGQIFGLDVCDAMLELAKQRNGQRQVDFAKGDLCEIGFASASMDLVTGGYALRNAPDLNAALDEVQRVLRPGGTAVFLDFSKPPHKWFQAMEHVLLVTWGSLWGAVLHRNPEVYAYIARSLRLYPDRDALRGLLETRGFTGIKSQRFYLGALELLTFEKPK